MLTSRGRSLLRTLGATTLRGRRRPSPFPPPAANTMLAARVFDATRYFPAARVVSLRLCTADCSSSSSSTYPRCWSCDRSAAAAAEPFLSCPSCRAVQPVDPALDYFQIFGIERDYEIKDDNLEGKYKDWQKKLHPDLFHTKSEREKKYSAEQSARVIEAYRTLKKPISRALYVLELEGMQVDEEQTLSDPELLSEVMDIREAVEEANEAKALEGIKCQIQGKLERWSNSFSNALKSRRFAEAVESIRRMIYYEKAIQEIVKKL